jgi:hypothetical protein
LDLKFLEMKSIVTTILQRFQNQVKSQGKSRTGSLQGGAQTIHETVEGPTTLVVEDETPGPTTLVVEDGTPGPTAAVEATKAPVVHEGKATVAVEATKALVVHVGKATVAAAATKAQVVQETAD